MKKTFPMFSVLATNVLVIVICVLFTSAISMAQKPSMPRLGTTFAEVQLRLEDESLPLDQWVNADNLHAKSEYLSVLYTFEKRQLNRIHVVRDYPRPALATAGLDGYLIYLERAQASILPVMISEKAEIYSAMTAEAIYSLTLNRSKKGMSQLTVTIQRRNSEIDPNPAPVRIVNSEIRTARP